MENKLLNDKAVNKKSALKGVWLIVIAAVIFIFILFKYAQNSGAKIGEVHAPEKEDVYEVAKKFIADDTGTSGLDFSDSYSYGKQGDSVYIIKSTYHQKIGSDESKIGDFSVVLKYKGGDAGEQNNWDLLNINKD